MFSEKQIEFLRGLGLDFDFQNLTDEEYFQVEDQVAEELQYRGFDEAYEPTAWGKMCESILDTLARME